MHVGNQMVSGTTLQTNMAATRTVIVELKYINSKNVVIHSENCKIEIPLDITAQQLSKKFVVWLASKKQVRNVVYWSGAPNENIVQNHLNIELLNIF